MVERLRSLSIPRQVRRHWLTLSFVLGFIIDNLTLNSVEQLFDNLVLATYVLLAMASLFALYAATAGKLPERFNDTVRTYAPLAVQFSFGGLLSGMLIFYGRSGDWFVSWPFLLVILAVIYFNETLTDRATRLIYNLAILFIGLTSYVVLIVPVLTGTMGALVFIGSGFLALALMYGFVQLLYRIVPRFMALQMRAIVFTLGLVYVGMNVLYFTNIIPPIPLSLKEAGIYHSVIRFENGDYQLKYEPGPWWRFWEDSASVFHPTVGGAVFCYAKVFAPTRLDTDIYHRWEYRTEAGDWVQHFRTSYPITGGSDGGYRGYTLVQNFRPGAWRCSVETARGQVLGREYFTIDPTTPPGELSTRID